MKTIRIAGVPEHFNFPWHLAIEDGLFAEVGLDVTWIDVPEGTGKMREMLRENSTDLAIILTGGIIKDIINGNPSKIVQIYVSSPLLWGVHVAGNSNYNTITDLENKTAAISRFGSGSHLVTYLQAKNYGWNTKSLSFKIVNTLDGAVNALTNGEADYFMWEHFTTKPLVDKGIFKRLGDCPTPWPCFVIAANENFLANNKTTLKQVLKIINTVTADFKDIPSIDKTLANRYHLALNDIRAWLAITDWSQENISEATIKAIQKELLAVNIIDKEAAYSKLVTNL